MSLQKAKNLGRSKKQDAQTFYKPTEQPINELDEEQNLSDSSEGPVIAKNTHFSSDATANLKAMKDFQHHETAYIDKKGHKQ